MAFHDPNPRLREIERRNAQARAALFAKVFRGIGRALRQPARRLRRRAARACAGTRRRR